MEHHVFRFGPISFGKKQNPNMPFFTLHFTGILALKVCQTVFSSP